MTIIGLVLGRGLPLSGMADVSIVVGRSLQDLIAARGEPEAPMEAASSDGSDDSFAEPATSARPLLVSLLRLRSWGRELPAESTGQIRCVEPAMILP
jgi:hypothetical protein